VTHETFDEREARGPNRPVYVDVTTTGKIETVISVCGRLSFAILYDVRPNRDGGQVLTFRMSQADADEWRVEEVIKARIEHVAGVVKVEVER
jgi:hypothetical protein